MDSQPENLTDLTRRPTGGDVNVEFGIAELEDYENTSFNDQPGQIDLVHQAFETDIEAAKDKNAQKELKKRELWDKKRRELQNMHKGKIVSDESIRDSTRSEANKILIDCYQSFGRERKGNWHLQTQEGRNFLHHLAYQPWVRNGRACPAWIVTAAISERPDLMDAIDLKGRTPLTGTCWIWISRRVLS